MSDHQCSTPLVSPPLITASPALPRPAPRVTNRSTYRTGFLPPPDANVMLKLLEPLLDVEVQAWGGYEQASHTHNCPRWRNIARKCRPADCGCVAADCVLSLSAWFYVSVRNMNR